MEKRQRQRRGRDDHADRARAGGSARPRRPGELLRRAALPAGRRARRPDGALRLRPPRRLAAATSTIGDRLAMLDWAADSIDRARGRRRRRRAAVRPAAATVRRHDLPPAAVPRPHRGQPARPGRRPLRHVRRPPRLLPAVGQPGRPHGARRVRHADPRDHRWSDDVCTALQVVEHCQDVGEDARAGRVYLPAEDLRAPRRDRRRAARAERPADLRAAVLRSRPARARTAARARDRRWRATLPGRDRWPSPASSPAGSPPSTPSSARRRRARPSVPADAPVARWCALGDVLRPRRMPERAA